MSEKTPAQEWAEFEDEQAGLLTRSFRQAAGFQNSPQPFVGEGQAIKALLAAGDNFMAKLHAWAQQQVRDAIARERERASQPQPKRTA